MHRICVFIVLAACLIASGCGQSGLIPQSTGARVAAGTHMLGNQNAKVKVIEFGDFECPYCASFHTETEWQIVNTYVNTGKALFAYRHYPLRSIHPDAEIAAEASECAARAGGNDAFWKYHDLLFTKGHESPAGLEPDALKQYAADLQLDTNSFNACLDNRATASIVSKDLADGAAAGVSGTPTFFINGRPLYGAGSFSDLQAAIEASL